MTKELKGRRALVSGATRGIGKAIAMNLAGHGVFLVICGRSFDKLEKTVEEIWAETGNRPSLIQANVCEDGAIESMFQLSSLSGGLDILINNVGGPMKTGNLFELDNQDWLDVFNLNLMTAVRFSKTAIPLLRKSRHPRIINISSLVAHQPGKYNPHYGVAKAGLEYFTKYLATELAKDGILVNAIAPDTLKGGGWVDNVQKKADMMQISFGEAEVLMERECSAKVPLGHIGQLEDIAELVTFLVSDKAKHITGSVFDVDGGRRASVR